MRKTASQKVKYPFAINKKINKNLITSFSLFFFISHKIEKKMASNCLLYHIFSAERSSKEYTRRTERRRRTIRGGGSGGEGGERWSVEEDEEEEENKKYNETK